MDVGRRQAWGPDPERNEAMREGSVLALRTDSARSMAVAAVLVVVAAIAAACATYTSAPAPVEPPITPTTLVVSATAYNSVPAQTDSDPTVTAHGVRLRPGMQVIAVSRDLEAMGMAHGTRVQIEGLPGEWTVVDRMAARWRRRIDVYMGLDLAGARQFGRREVELRWSPESP